MKRGAEHAHDAPAPKRTAVETVVELLKLSPTQGATEAVLSSECVGSSLAVEAALLCMQAFSPSPKDAVAALTAAQQHAGAEDVVRAALRIQWTPEVLADGDATRALAGFVCSAAVAGNERPECLALALQWFKGRSDLEGLIEQPLEGLADALTEEVGHGVFAVARAAIRGGARADELCVLALDCVAAHMRPEEGEDWARCVAEAVDFMLWLCRRAEGAFDGPQAVARLTACGAVRKLGRLEDNVAALEWVPDKLKSSVAALGAALEI